MESRAGYFSWLRCRSVPVLEMDDASGSDEERGVTMVTSVGSR